MFPGSTAGSLPPELTQRAVTIYIYGGPRWAVNLTLFAFAQEINPEFQWLDIREADLPDSASVPVRLEWVPPSRVHVAHGGEEMKPSEPVPHALLRSILSSEESSETVNQFANFLRLPAITQAISAVARPGSRPGVIAAANTDRVSHLYPPTVEGMRPLLNAMTAQSITLLVSHSGPIETNAAAFDYDFEVVATTPSEWRDGRLSCTRGTLPGMLREGNAVPFERLAALSRVCQKLVTHQLFEPVLTE